MQTDPLVEWQRLTETYGKMYDEELLNLAADSADLTEQARQVLSGEMRKRGLELRRPPGRAPRGPNRFAAMQRAAETGPPENGALEPENAPPHDFTWKTLLCECADQGEAWQVCEMLRQVGIESWIDGPQGSYSPYSPELDLKTPRVLVAADQLEEAREIAARPIPQEIMEQSRMQEPEFEPPVCPKCGAGDPVLEDVDPCNTWHCEACDHDWSESAPDPEDNPENGRK